MNEDGRRNVTVVTNPLSGLGKGADAAGAALARFAERGVTVTEVRTGSPAESVRRVRDSIDDPLARPDAVVCIGGDGLVSILLAAVARTGVPLGLIPAGTGNDLARELGVPTEDPVAAADLVLDGRIRTIDLGRVEARDAEPMWFATVTGTGLDARVTLRANEMRWPKGRLRYTVAALRELSTGLTVPYRIELTGVSATGRTTPAADRDTVVETDAVMVAVGNTRAYGGGMLICPDAVMDDGLLDVTVVGALSRLEMLRLLPALSAGKRLDHPDVKQYRAAGITLTAPGVPATADGEPAGGLPVTIRAVPGALDVLVP
ncbi:MULTISPECIES: diacylglycerol kinase [unclassified Nocardia]|uniref:diacylglycerol kinase n=1 Tax=unclassified Nocardia TaxID=2637762 RepID=UPI001CE49350|nr:MULTISPECIES: diacylglycerol kinase [unclassified Nocardia]